MMKLTLRSLIAKGYTNDASWWLMPMSESTVYVPPIKNSHLKRLYLSSTLGEVTWEWLDIGGPYPFYVKFISVVINCRVCIINAGKKMAA